MKIKTWKLGYLEQGDPTPRRMLGWNVVDWSEYNDEYNDCAYTKNVRNWIKENCAKGTYRISYQYPECLIEREEDLVLLMLRWG